MSLSEAHEDIIDICATAINIQWLHRARWPQLGPFFISDGVFGKISCGIPNTIKIKPDFYIVSPPDNYGPILGEVGKMPDGKWNWLRWTQTQKPVRILRIGFDGSVSIINACFTEFEKELVMTLTKSLHQELHQ